MKSRKRLTFDPIIFLAKAGDCKTMTEYSKHQTIFAQGDSADAIFYLKKGKPTLKVVSRQGKEAVIAILGPGDFFGEGCLADIRIEEDLVDQLFNSSEKRLARILLLLANYGKEGQQEPVPLRISQETLAEIVGTTRSRVSFFMNKFRKLGFIDYNGGLRVNSSLLNVVLHD